MSTQEILNLFDTQLSGDNGCIEYEHSLPNGFLLFAEQNPDKEENPLDYDGWLLSLTSTGDDNDYCHSLPISPEQAKTLILGLSNSQLECRGYSQDLKDYFQSLGKDCEVMVNPNTAEEDLVFNRPPFQRNAPMNSVWFWQGVVFERFVKSQSTLPELVIADFLALFPNTAFAKEGKKGYTTINLTDALSIRADYHPKSSTELEDAWFFELLCDCQDCGSAAYTRLSIKEAIAIHSIFIKQ